MIKTWDEHIEELDDGTIVTSEHIQRAMLEEIVELRDMVERLRGPARTGDCINWSLTADEISKQYRDMAMQVDGLVDALEHALSIYGKFDALVNDPNDPGGWIVKARRALEKAGKE